MSWQPSRVMTGFERHRKGLKEHGRHQGTKLVSALAEVSYVSVKVIT